MININNRIVINITFGDIIKIENGSDLIYMIHINIKIGYEFLRCIVSPSIFESILWSKIMDSPGCLETLIWINLLTYLVWGVSLPKAGSLDMVKVGVYMLNIGRLICKSKYCSRLFPNKIQL